MFVCHMGKNNRHLVISAMRNEGAFIVEWVSWYRMLGFEIMVLTNDCTDRSPQLLDALELAGWLTHVRHAPYNEPPKKSAHRAARSQTLIDQIDWVFVCDVDEFLVFHQGDGTVGGYLETLDMPFRGVSIHWRCFGTSGIDDYQAGLVHRQFTHAAISHSPANVNFKTLFHTPTDFQVFAAHAPRMQKRRWGTPKQRLVTGGGVEIEDFHPKHNVLNKTDIGLVDHSTAQVNHYITRSFESFTRKLGTPSASRGVNRYTPNFFNSYNRNEIEDHSALRDPARFDAVYAETMALPGIADLHHLCVADYIESLCAVEGTEHRDDPRWIAAMTALG
jgi:hypothetical protein